MKTAAFLLLAGVTAMTSGVCADADAGTGLLEVRQVVIRMPELEMVGLMTDAQTHKTEAARIGALWQAVKEGRARVISDLTSAVDAARSVAVRQGQQVWLPTELEQDTERLHMPPVSHHEYFVGTSLECDPRAGYSGAMPWIGVCMPRGPAMVKWPVSWLNVYVNFQPDPKNRLIRGWLDFHDTFAESTTGSVWMRGSAMQMLAVMPPADQVWPGDRAGRWLDVFLAQLKAPGQEPAAPELAPEPATVPEPPSNREPADPFAPAAALRKRPAKANPMGQMTMIYGISIGAAEAAMMTLQRDPALDAALLEQLLARVRAGTARMHVCVGTGNDPHTRHTITSTRLHQVPSEMPSIPSAWDTCSLGTTLEMDGTILSLHQDLAPPGRTEWKLALDDPQAVMWQPRPRALDFQAEDPSFQGTHLLGLLHIPEVMRQEGSGLLKDESILFFAQHHGGPAPAPQGADRPPAFEAEVIVLEMPGTNADDFQGLPGDPLPEEEDDRFRQLMDRVKTGEVRVAAHSMVVGRGDKLLTRIAEEHKTATEFDPPEFKHVPRMRPTALETIYAGSELEIEVQPMDLSAADMLVVLAFKHSTGLPAEPDLPATLAIAAKDGNTYPGAALSQETWISEIGSYFPDAQGVKVHNGKPYCLGVRKPPGITRKVIHVAYLRVRRL